MKSIIYTLTAAALIMAGCAGPLSSVTVKDPGRGQSGAKNPAAAQFPASKYLTATGMGQSEEEARSQAKAELSNIFESKVFSATINKVRSVSDTAGSERVTRDAEQRVRVISSVDLKGVEIGSTWFDNKDKLHYALAVLDRHKARENWESEAEGIDARIEAAYKALPSHKSRFSRLQSLRKMNRLWLEKEVVVSRLRVLGFQELSMGTYDIKTILREIEEIKASLLVAIVPIEGEYGKIIGDALAERLGEEGYVLTARKGEANILLTGRITVKPVQLDNPDWQFARASATLAMVDRETGLTVGEFSENKRAAQIYYAEAAVKAARGVSQLLSDKVVRYFADAE